MTRDRIKRLSITLIFFIHGSIFGNWVTRIPEVKHRLELNEAELGLLLFGISLGLIVTINFTGGFIDRFGSKMVTLLASIAAGTILPLMAIAPSFILMWLALFVYGSCMTFMDVAMNAQGVEIENNHLHYPIMSSLHAAYSIGGFVGASYGGYLISIQVPVLFHFLTVTTVVYVLTLVLSKFLVLDKKEDGHEKVPVFKIPPKALWPLGIIGLLSSVGEGTLSDWTGVYLIEIIKVDEAQAAWGFAIFSLSMTIGRLAGDKIIQVYSRPTVLRLCGILSTSGLLFTIMTGNYILNLIGITISGFGLSVIIPIVFSAAGNMPGIPSGVSIASVASIGYLGFLAGPPTIGLIAELTSLRVAFGLIAVSLLGVILLANHSDTSDISDTIDN